MRTRNLHRHSFAQAALFLAALVLLSGCRPVLETEQPGRAAEREVGPVAEIYPRGEPSRRDRHGLWRGMDGDRMIWEVRYTRGVPTGPYREWNARGELIATWPYNWDGEIDGWVRWFTDGQPDGKIQLSPGEGPETDMIGNAAGFKIWMQDRIPQD